MQLILEDFQPGRVLSFSMFKSKVYLQRKEKQVEVISRIAFVQNRNVPIVVWQVRKGNEGQKSYVGCFKI